MHHLSYERPDIIEEMLRQCGENAEKNLSSSGILGWRFTALTTSTLWERLRKHPVGDI
ncbi:hypothetical protein LN650_23755 [Klebsiella pneumoniae subsp. pneumoniae]|nr:hypothetical protein [Klebsiella pneumoniae subsp. pneumoniae]